MVSPAASRFAFRSRFVAAALCAAILFASPLLTTCQSDPFEPGAIGGNEPLLLDLSGNRHAPIESVLEIASLAGQQEFDGVPFQIDGPVWLYGKIPETNRQEVYPDSALGVKVGRKFDELHLIHHTTWPDVQGDTVAYIRLNYADDTKFTFPIRYGVHVLDWYDLPSYAEESVVDLSTTICWRHPPRAYNAPLRLFKSTFANPFPDKSVQTLDVISAKSLAAYSLLAATVSNSKSVPQPELPAKQRFDANLVVCIVDDESDKPIEGALVLPAMMIEDNYLVGSPFRTSETGNGTIPYPTKTTTGITAQVSMLGYEDAFQDWEVPAAKESTIRLRRRAVE